MDKFVHASSFNFTFSFVIPLIMTQRRCSERDNKLFSVVSYRKHPCFNITINGTNSIYCNMHIKNMKFNIN